jgi:hypothetical protein
LESGLRLLALSLCGELMRQLENAAALRLVLGRWPATLALDASPLLNGL